ncbi:hypothetical protein [Metallosphaera sp.]|uniref:hypothetical protein n=1 Tax=Metallosphaera sp. TaxID=2020860 RepID=UPI0031706B52
MINENLESINKKSKEYIVSVGFWDFMGAEYRVMSNLYSVVEEGIVKKDIYFVKFRAMAGDIMNIKIGKYYLWIRVMESDMGFDYDESSVSVVITESTGIGGE